MKMYEHPQKLNQYLDRKFECSCGRTHYAPIKEVSIRQGAVEDIPGLIEKYGYKNIYLISDPNTYEAGGRRIMELLEQAGIQSKMLVLKHINFDEATAGEIFINKPRECDLMVAVGSGTINDMTRFMSYGFHLPFFTAATAASMDGFASTGASLSVNNLKTSFQTHTPEVIIGDVDILRAAPYNMIAAGLGDLLGKYTCIADWKLARIIIQEEYCDKIVELVESCVSGVLKVADKARDRDPQVQEMIMEGLVLTGVAMSLHGNSRPASGCEHHMSHYWEMMLEQRGVKSAPHGTQVSVGTVLVLKLIEKLKEYTVDFDKAREASAHYDAQQWEKEIRRAYGSAAEGVIAIEREAGKNETEGRLQRIDIIEKNWKEIMDILSALPSSEKMIEILQSLGAPYLPEQIHVDRALLKDTFMYCKEVRLRYTLLQMLWDLDILDELSDQVIEEICGK